MTRPSIKVTRIAELVPETEPLRKLEAAADILESLRDNPDFSALPISCVPRLRQMISRIETSVLILRKSTIG